MNAQGTAAISALPRDGQARPQTLPLPCCSASTPRTARRSIAIAVPPAVLWLMACAGPLTSAVSAPTNEGVGEDLMVTPNSADVVAIGPSSWATG